MKVMELNESSSWTHRVKEFINDLFQVREGEWSKLLLILVLNLFLGIGASINDSAAESLFLSNLELKNLSWMFIITGFLRFFSSMIYAPFADRISNDKLFVNFLLIAGAVLIIFRFAINFPLPIGIVQDFLGGSLIRKAVFLMFYSFNFVITAFIITHFTPYVLSIYNTLEYKRLGSIISAFKILGIIIGGFSVGPLLKLFFTPDLIFVVVSAFLICIFIIKTVSVKFPAGFLGLKKGTKKRRRRRGDSKLQHIKQGFKFISKSNLVKITAVSTFVLVILLQLIKYQYSGVFKEQFPTQEELASFFGMFKAWSNIISLIIPLFFTQRLVRRFGVGNSNMIFPSLTFLSAIFLSTRTYSAALFSRFVKQALKPALRRPISNILYSAIPDKMRGRTRTFIIGFVAPMGAITAGLLVLSIDKFDLLLTPGKTYLIFSAFATVLAVLFFYFTYRQKNEYSKSILKMLQEKINFEELAHRELGKVDEKAFLEIQNALLDKDDDIAIFAANIMRNIAENQKAQAVTALLNALEKQKSSRVRKTIIDVLGDMSATAAVPALRKLLNEDDNLIQQSTIEALGKLGNEDIIDEIRGLTQDDGCWVRASAALALINTQNNENREMGLDVLMEMLGANLSEEQESAVNAFAKLNNPHYIVLLSKYLANANLSVARSAAEGIERLAEKNSKLATEVMVKALDSEDSGIRIAAARTLRKTLRPEATEYLVKHLDDPNHRVRKLVIETLSLLGKSSSDELFKVLKSDEESVTSKISAVSAMNTIQIAGRRDELIDEAIRNLKNYYQNIYSIYLLNTVERHRAVELLIDSLRDENAQILSLVLHILGALTDHYSFQIIEKKLKSGNDRVHANAVEAIDSIAEKKVSRLLIPLLDGTEFDDCMELAEEEWDFDFNKKPEDVISAKLQGDDNWHKACALFSVGELADSNYLNVVKESLTSQNKYVQEAAREALSKIQNDQQIADSHIQ